MRAEFTFGEVKTGFFNIFTEFTLKWLTFYFPY